MDINDKVCEQIDLALAEQIYPKEVVERCVQQSQPWLNKARRVRQTNAESLVWLLIGMGLWSRPSQSWCGKSWWAS